MNDTLLFVLISIVDITASVIIFAGALSERMRLYPAWHKIGLIMAAMGLVAQAFRNMAYLFTGISPSDADLPLWILKDAGIATIAYFYAAKAFGAGLASARAEVIATEAKAEEFQKEQASKAVKAKPAAKPKAQTDALPKAGLKARPTKLKP